MNSDEKIDYVRANMPATQGQAYLNAGTSGPLSTVTLDALQTANEFDGRVGRGSSAARPSWNAAKNELREAYARLTNASVDAIALTQNTTNGMNIAILGVNWRPGDEIIINNWEHPGGYVPAYIARQRFGAELRFVTLELGDSGDEVVDKLIAAIGPRTRMIVVSHIMWNTGLTIPLKRLAAAARERGVITMIDAAQSAGHIPLDLPASGVDFYAMPGQKWLCGIEGTGALYARPESLSYIDPTFGGFATLAGPNGYDMTGRYLPHPSAKRFEMGSLNRPAIKGMVANLNWLENEVGWDWIFERSQQMRHYAFDAISNIDGIEMITRRDAGSTLLTFSLGEHDAAEAVATLLENNVVVRYIRDPYTLRVSIGFYNNEEDVDSLVSNLERIVGS